MGLRRQTRGLAVVAASAGLLFFSNAPVYAGLFVWPIQPLHFIAALLTVTLALIVTFEIPKLHINSSLAIWCVAYVVVLCVWYMTLGAGADEYFRKRLLAMAFLAVMYSLFADSDESVLLGRKFLAAWTVAAAFINLYDLTHPFALVPLSSEFANPGRAAGLYINANMSGISILLGLILGVSVVPARLRIPYVSLGISGALLTVSRAAFVGCILTLGALWICDVVRLRQVVAAVLVPTVVLLGAWQLFAGQDGATQIDTSRFSERIGWFLDSNTVVDQSQMARTRVAEKAWDKIAENPIFGSGIAATERWQESLGAHNTYLALMADFGIWAIFLYPLLLFASVHGSTGEANRVKPAFLAVMFFWGLFDHAILSTYCILVPIALMAAMSYRSALTPQSNPGSALLQRSI